MTQIFGKVTILIVFAIMTTIAFYMIVPPPSALSNINLQTTSSTVVYAKVTAPVGEPFSTHATDKHNEHAIRGEECGLSPTMTMYNPSTNRFADICTTSAGLFGLFIYEIQNGIKREVTAMEKDKMRIIDQVIKNLQNGGYTSELPSTTPGIVLP